MSNKINKLIDEYNNKMSDEEYFKLMSEIQEFDTSIRDISIGSTIYDFVFNHSYLSCIMGPVGSGKSTGSILKIFLYSQCIMPSMDKIRRSKWIVVRNTRKELKDTTIKTFLQWLQPFGIFEKTDMNFQLKFNDVHSEIQFLALDDAKDAGKLLSLECTGIYFNELSQIDHNIWETAQQRIGRYPSLKANGTLAWFDYRKAVELGINVNKERVELHPINKMPMYQIDCIFADTNPPRMGSYYHKLFEKKLFSESGIDNNPIDFKIYKQPSGMSHNAENKKNLKSNYYEDIIKNSPKEKSDVMVHVQYSLGESGLGIYRNHFDRKTHIGYNLYETFYKDKTNTNNKLLIGMDFGLNPAVVICQLIEGKLYIYDEIYTKNDNKVGLTEFLDTKFEPLLEKKYPKFFKKKENILFIVDPAGNQKNQLTGTTLIREIKDRGYTLRLDDSNNRVQPRLEAVKKMLTLIKSEVCFFIDSKCDWTISGLGGNYYYEQSKTGFKDEPCKNEYSHIQDGLQYLCKHIVTFNDKHTKIDNNGNNEYNNDNYRNTLDEKMGY